jgi:hypothetical protein
MKATFVVLLFLAMPLMAEVKFSRTADQIEVTVDGKPFSTFYIPPGAPKPYLHPLRSASGKIVTRRFPMEKVPGEKTDHPHHRGLWFTHGDVNGFDFWMNETDYKRPNKGIITTKEVGAVKDGKKAGSIQASFEWRSPENKPLLTETRTMVFHSNPMERVIDCDIVLKAIEKSVFGDTKEGTFAIRLATQLQEEGNSGRMVSADGKATEKAVWGTASPWVDYSGVLDGEKLGIAILHHPSSTRHPNYWHARAYGLFAANIFGLHDFLRDKTKNGSLTLEPGQSARFRYRVIIHAGDTESANIAQRYKEYAAMK